MSAPVTDATVPKKRPPQDIGTSYYCSDCGEHINAKDVPVVVYLVAGVIGGGQELPVGAVHPGIQAVLEQPIARRVWCADCTPKGLADILAEPAAPIVQQPPAPNEKGEPGSAEG